MEKLFGTLILVILLLKQVIKSLSLNQEFLLVQVMDSILSITLLILLLLESILMAMKLIENILAISF